MLETDEDRATVELWKRELIELLDRTDSLSFETGAASSDESELDIDAELYNLHKVIDFVDSHLQAILRTI